MSLKKSFTKDGKCNVTFTVTAEAAQGAKSVTIAGDFNSWSSTETPLKKGKVHLKSEKSISSAIFLMVVAGKMIGPLTNIFPLRLVPQIILWSFAPNRFC